MRRIGKLGRRTTPPGCRAITLFLGIDIGTSGARAAVIDGAAAPAAEASRRFGADAGTSAQTPGLWRAALAGVMEDLRRQIDLKAVTALAVDGTSGSVLAADKNGAPTGRPLMYDAHADDPETLAALRRLGLEHLKSAAAGRAFMLMRRHPGARILHQADYISGLFSGRFNITDDNNALKTGFDPETRAWSADAEKLSLPAAAPGDVVPPGTVIAAAEGAWARRFGLPRSARVVAGTTDGCAAFLAAGAGETGDAVTVLGSTITLKMLSPRRLEDAQSGVYSHRLLGAWLAGGASNSGGRVLDAHFTSAQIAHLSAKRRPGPETGLYYYPLLTPGERFPEADPKKPPRLTPRPEDDADFLKAMFEGMARIEASGYKSLRRLGGPQISRVFTVGGGAQNLLWRGIRAKALGLKPLNARFREAAFGAALLARRGAGQ